MAREYTLEKTRNIGIIAHPGTKARMTIMEYEELSHGCRLRLRESLMKEQGAAWYGAGIDA